MTVLPFPNESDPEKGTPDLFGLVPMNLLGEIVDSLGDVTVGQMLEAIEDVPLKDILKELLP